MITVVEAISDMNIGGAGILLVNRLKNTNRKIFDTWVILPRGSMLVPRIKSTGAHVVTVDTSKEKSFDVRDVPKYWTAIKKISPNIINAHGNLSARIAAKMANVPIRLYTRHCVYPVGIIYKMGFVRRFFGIATDIISNGVIAVSHSAKENLIKMGVKDKRIAVIINGAQEVKRLDEYEKVKVKKRLDIPKDACVITICARLEKCKDHKCFLDAARILCKRGDKYRFLIVGGGSLEEQLKQMAKKYGLENKIIFTGFVEDVSPFMNITDINVNCSVGTETSSLALSEGMSCGIPCVASDYGGNPYMVRDGVNGYLYRAGDSADLAKKIEKIKDGCNYNRLSMNSRARFERELNAKTMSKKIQMLYLKLVSKNHKKS